MNNQYEKIKIGIHRRQGSYSDRWIKYCEENNITYKIVNCYSNDIIKQLDDCNALLWHHTQGDNKDLMCAKKILFSLEHTGKLVYPNFKTNWHFDDKVAQKYLLESINTNFVPSYVFYSKEEALEWMKSTTFPKVFKLAGGSGSKNVLLVKSLSECKKMINKAFGKGIYQHDPKNAFKDDLIRFKKEKNIIHLIKAPLRYVYISDFVKKYGRDKGYIYFQEFIPDNKYDIRVVVIGNRAIAEKRFVRENDFRASGSSSFSYEGINIKAIEIAFEVTKILNLQSVAFDFVIKDSKIPLIVEISYGFGRDGITKAPGFWDDNLEWYSSIITPEDWILEDLINKIKQ